MIMLSEAIVTVNNYCSEKRMGRVRATKQAGEPVDGVGFLLSQVGAHAAAGFKERLAPLKLAPPHAGILRIINQSDGLTQQALGERLGVFPSRLVSLLDELEEREPDRATRQPGRPAVVRALPHEGGARLAAGN